MLLLIGAAWNLTLAVLISRYTGQYGPFWPPWNNADERRLPGYLGVYGPVRASTRVAPSWTGIVRTEWWLWSCDVAAEDRTPENAAKLNHAYVVQVVEAGWPLPTLSRDKLDIYEQNWSLAKFSGEQLAWLDRAGLRAGVLYEGVDPKDRWERSYFKIIPVIPRWAGVIGGAFFWAGVCWLAVVGWRLVRRLRAVGPGACPACGYDRRGLPMCPECGPKAA